MSDDLLDALSAVGNGALLQGLPAHISDPIVEQAQTRDDLYLALRALDIDRSHDKDRPVFQVGEDRYMTLQVETDE